MSQYQLFNRMYNYDGGFGHANKKSMYEIDSSRFDRDYFPIEEEYNKLDDFSSSFIHTQGLPYRIKRDMAIDTKNPQEKLSEDAASAMLIDTVPQFAYSNTPDMSLPSDFELNDQVKMIQSSYANATKQAQLFTDPSLAGDDSYNTDKVGKGTEPGKQLQLYSMDGSAAGLESNHLGSEATDESYRKNSIETMSAF